jgi:hypothetical protein
LEGRDRLLILRRDQANDFVGPGLGAGALDDLHFEGGGGLVGVEAEELDGLFVAS